MTKYKTVSIDQIKEAETKLRLTESDVDLPDLTESIRRIGVLVPLTVLAEDDGYRLLSGHRRLAACRAAGKKTVPVLVQQFEAQAAAEASIAENMWRRNLSPIEEAAALKDLLAQGLYNQQQAAAMMHRSVGWVKARVAMLNWPDDVLKAVHDGWLAASAGQYLARVDDPTYRGNLLYYAGQNGVNARTAAAWLQAYEMSVPEVEAEGIEAEPEPTNREPVIPQAPCIVCGQPYTYDKLTHPALCFNCLEQITRSVSRA